MIIDLLILTINFYPCAYLLFFPFHPLYFGVLCRIWVPAVNQLLLFREGHKPRATSVYAILIKVSNVYLFVDTLVDEHKKR